MIVDRFWELLSKKIFSEATDAELKEFGDFLSHHPDLTDTAETFNVLAYQSAPIETGEHIESAFERHIQKMRAAGIEYSEAEPSDIELANINERRGKTPRKRWSLVVLALSGIVIVSLIFRNRPLSAEHAAARSVHVNGVSTPPGSKSAEIHLPDGSSVRLNASSDLTYDKDFGKNLREVNLTGEAFFNVVKDPSRPFIVHTKVIDVKVLGTEFNVKAYPNDPNTETSLIRGSVEVTVKNRSGEKLHLKPNEKIKVPNDVPVDPKATTAVRPKTLILPQPLTYDRADSTVIVETSWMQNKLVFQENETFREVALKMERWYGVQISFTNENVAQMRPFGSFTNETITQALDELRESLRFNYKISGNYITITNE